MDLDLDLQAPEGLHMTRQSSSSVGLDMLDHRKRDPYLFFKFNNPGST